MSRFWSKSLHDLTPYTPGEQPKLDQLIKLNTNENPYGPSPKVIEAIAAANNSDLRKYPDPSASELTQTIAQYYHLHNDQVYVGNSSDEVLAHTFRAFFQHDLPLLYPDITYSFYPVYCQLFDIEFKRIPLREDFSIGMEDYAQPNGGIIFANPNAPTGLALATEQIKALLEHNTDSVVVVDEAYVDFCDASAVSLIDEFPNLLITQTLSKSRSLAGLRVGFALGQSELIVGLERVKNSFHPYSLDSLALAGANASFLDNDYFELTCANIIQTRAWTQQALVDLGFNVLDSSTNFVFASHASKSAECIFTELRKRNIVIRYFNAPRIDNFVRISIGTDEQMQACISALKEIVSR